MTPKTMQWLAYSFIIILMMIAVYPFIQSGFYSAKFTEIAILGSTEKIGEYPKEISLGEELSLNIYLENHEKETKLYKIVIKIVDNSTLTSDSPPFEVTPSSEYLTILKDNENTTYPIKVVLEKPFIGKLVAELFMFDESSSTYFYHDRWVAIWMNTTN